MAAAPYYAKDSRVIHEVIDDGLNQAPAARGGYDDPSNSTSMYPDPLQALAGSSGPNAYLHGLVAAATEVAAEEQHADRDIDQLLYRQSDRVSKGTRKRKETATQDEINHHQPSQQPRSKRRKHTALTSNNIDASDDTSIISQRSHSVEDEKTRVVDARAIGVHSAAALFRAPSELSKKYTRPPMSKVFNSLELSAEGFLRLQAAAKRYMLDPAHPERKNGVGNRSKGEPGQVRLDLSKSVREFLERGPGEEYFGTDSASLVDGEDGVEAERRTNSWPEDKEKIIRLCTPLLRRMVTNERQRHYAVESRKTSKSVKQIPGNVARQNDQVSLVPRGRAA